MPRSQPERSETNVTESGSKVVRGAAVVDVGASLGIAVDDGSVEGIVVVDGDACFPLEQLAASTTRIATAPAVLRVLNDRLGH